MRYLFYITDHGFGHASRNVPIIQVLLKKDPCAQIIICSDSVRCSFIRRHFSDSMSISYRENYHEPGIILAAGKSFIDITNTRVCVENDLVCRDERIQEECILLNSIHPDVVISDIIGWPLKAAAQCDIPSLLIGNFIWSDMYRSILGETIADYYEECYRAATHVIWYEFHNPALHEVNPAYEMVSLAARDMNPEKVRKIRDAHDRPVIFITLGGSMQLSGKYDVSGLPYDFIVTPGIHFTGKNVEYLPADTINTPDYIHASECVIAKGGWSTIAEILLAKKKCALLFRGNNPEDAAVSKMLVQRNQCYSFTDMNLLEDINHLILKTMLLQPDSYDNYRNDKEIICERIIMMAGGKRND